HYKAVNVRDQEANPTSLLAWMRRIIAIRKRFLAFGRGSLDFIETDNPKVLAFTRRYGDETLVIVANLARQTQAVRLDLSAYAGRALVELFGGATLPVIGDEWYALTLGPYAFYWFVAPPVPTPAASIVAPVATGALRFGRRWEDVLTARSTGGWLADYLPAFLDRQPWRAPGDAPIRTAKLLDYVHVAADHGSAALCLAQAETLDDQTRVYLAPVAFATGATAETICRDRPDAVIARAIGDTTDGVLYDATHDAAFANAVRLLALTRRWTRARHGELNRDAPTPTHARAPASEVVSSETAGATTVYRFADQVVARLFHRVEPGVHPDWEIGEALTARNFTATPAVIGAIDWRLHAQPEPYTIAVARLADTALTDAWSVVVGAVTRAFEQDRQPDRREPS
ncbi:MAG: alpha-glucosidase C-terminal domain-containing protein, partial [Dehalococcoidia bacterium]|nr:alpha-glucosidase C-terminal domain-containing protein [Dehalococcoidia bacterium]